MILRHFLEDYSAFLNWDQDDKEVWRGTSDLIVTCPCSLAEEAEPVYHTAITTQQFQLRTDLAPDEKHPKPSSQSPFCLDMVLVVQRLE